VRVFGSVARDETDEASDIDFLVLGGLQFEPEALLGRRLDVVTANMPADPKSAGAASVPPTHNRAS
jgi:predicted nucleotidyltransferase